MPKQLTPTGLEKLKKELQFLKEVKRKEIAERLAKSVAYGDLSENSEYQEAKETQALLETKILDLEDLIRSAVVVFPTKGSRTVQMGSVVFVQSGLQKERFMIVGAEETDPLEGKISINSPLGKGLADKPEGVELEIHAPKGKTKYKILKIE